MADPMTLSVAAIGAVALTEGIKFLYGQAGELLKRWRERRDKAAQAAAAPTEQTEAVGVMLPAVFEGQLSGAVIHFDVLQQSERDLRRLYKDLSEYANEIEPVDSANDALLQNVDMLRQLLEAVYQQRITFKGEERPPSGSPLVIGRVEAQEISGDATGVEAEEAVGGEIRGDVKAERIAPGGHAIGAKVGSVGGKFPRRKPSDS